MYTLPQIFLSLLFLLSLFFIQKPYAQPLGTTSIHMDHVPISDAIQTMASALHLNVMVGADVKGEVTLHLENAKPYNVLQFLVASHELVMIKENNIWLIGTQSVWIKRKEEEKKWQALTLETATLITRTWKLHYANAEGIARMIKSEQGSLLSKRGHLQVDNRTNRLTVRDIAEQVYMLSHLINELDEPVKQVMIEARIASVDQDEERALGVAWGMKSDYSKEASPRDIPIHAEAGYYGFSLARLANHEVLDIKLAALEKAGRAELISSPRLFAANQETAFIEAGEEIPYQEISEGGGTATAFKKVVLGLKVTPQILPGEDIVLYLQIHQDRLGNRIVMGVPTISTRQVTTRVRVKNGETIVLGGIYEHSHGSDHRGWPFLSQLPILNWLFRQQITRQTKRELLIFVTPIVMV